MNWGKFFKKVFFGFLTGGAASVGNTFTQGAIPTEPEAITQHTIMGGVIAIIMGLTNWFKHKND